MFTHDKNMQVMAIAHNISKQDWQENKDKLSKDAHLQI